MYGEEAAGFLRPGASAHGPGPGVSGGPPCLWGPVEPTPGARPLPDWGGGVSAVAGEPRPSPAAASCELGRRLASASSSC